MKKLMNILIFQLLLSIISAILLSQMSWLGRIGISLLYKEYVILKEPTRTTPIIFGIQFLVILILHLFYVLSQRKTSRIICILIFILAGLGLAYTIHDFSQTFSHRILKSKFHFGGYLIWIGMMISSVYYFFQSNRKTELKIKSEEFRADEIEEEIHN